MQFEKLGPPNLGLPSFQYPRGVVRGSLFDREGGRIRAIYYIICIAIDIALLLKLELQQNLHPDEVAALPLHQGENFSSKISLEGDFLVHKAQVDLSRRCKLCTHTNSYKYTRETERYKDK